MARRVAALFVLFVCASCGNDLTETGDGGPSVESTAVTEAATGTSPGLTSPPVSTAPPPEATATSAVSTSDTPAPTTTGDRSDEALAFFRSTEADCAAGAAETGNPPLPPSNFAEARVINAVDPSYRIRDGSGNELLVNLEDRVVTSTSGAEGELPAAYSFACPTDLYPGTLHA